MVTQPVAFRTDSFPKFFAFINTTKHECFEGILARYASEPRHSINFCWMCMLGTFVHLKAPQGYDLFVVEDKR
jgi:hypothetical protein